MPAILLALLPIGLLNFALPFIVPALVEDWYVPYLAWCVVSGAWWGGFVGRMNYWR